MTVGQLITLLQRYRSDRPIGALTAEIMADADPGERWGNFVHYKIYHVDVRDGVVSIWVTPKNT